MRVRRWGAGLVWVPLVLPLMLSGCSDADGSSSPSTPSSPSQQSSPSPDATPTDEGPSIPPEAVGTDEASAKAFVRYWFEVLSEAMTTGDTDLARNLSLPQCRSCGALLDNFDAVYEAGGRFETKGWSVKKILPGLANQRAKRTTSSEFASIHVGWSARQVVMWINGPKK